MSAIPPSYASAGFTQADVSTISTALGTPIDQLPPLEQLTQADLQLIQTQDPTLYEKVSSQVAQPSLDPPKVKFDTAQMTMLLSELNKEIGELGVEFAQEGVKITGDKKKKISEERIKKLQDSIEKISKALKKEKANKVWSWIGAVVAVVAAVAVCVATGGAGLPLVFAAIGLVCAVASLTVMTLEETGAMEAMMDATCKARGYDEEETAKYKQNVRLAITITIAVVGLCAGVGSAVSAMKSGVTLATNATKIAGVIGAAGELAEAGAAIGSGATTIQATKARTDSMKSQADAKEFEAWLKKLQITMEQETDELQRALEILNKSAFQDPKKVLDSLHDLQMILAGEQEQPV